MKPTAYRYECPDDVGHVKDFVDICKTEIFRAAVQIVRNGGETNLHAHNGVDSMWFVLSGKAAFYDEDEERYELAKNDSIMLPAGTKYWFESLGDEPLEVLHLQARHPNADGKRIDATQAPARMGRIAHNQAPQLDPQSA